MVTYGELKDYIKLYIQEAIYSAKISTTVNT